jgi:putative tryptophan/tyrosine transport system substrate-binding protein
LSWFASFNRPGGNATGIYFLVAALEAKRAELLHELVPKAATMALLVDPNFPSAETQSREMQEAVRSLRLNLLVLKAGTTDEINTAFGTLVRERTGILSRFPTVSPECSRKLLRADVLRCEFYTAACAG